MALINANDIKLSINLQILLQLSVVLCNIHNQDRLYAGAFSPGIGDRYPMNEFPMPDGHDAFHDVILTAYVSD